MLKVINITYNPITGTRTIEQLTKEEMLQLYGHYGTFNTCSVMVGCDRKTFSRYWHEFNLPNPASLPPFEKKSDSEIYEFLAASDLHLGSNQQQATAFLNFVSIAPDNNIKDLVIPGDIIEGLSKRDGSVQSRFLHTIDTIYDYTCSIFNKFADNFNNIYIITGNHDETLNRRDDGFDICEHLSKDFKPVKYEKSPVDVVKPILLPGGAHAILFHGDGGCSCNLVSRTRSKTIDFINMNEDFDFLLCGHCHRSSYDFWLQKHGISLGSFQSLTDFLARKGKMPQVQGQRIQYQIDKRGKVCNLVNIPYNYDDKLIRYDHPT
jgi:UDP-2,3-diacylglucosamine pyrophosphatase LpxH